MATNENADCCPRLDPQLWDKKTFDWKDKKFIKDSVRTAFFIPLNFGSVMKRLDEKVRAAGATMPDSLCLSDHAGKWSMDVYLAVDKDIPGAQNETFSGTFLSRAYEGDFKQTGEWCKDFESYVKEQGKTIKKLYMWYTTCPKCAKKYGKNYVVIFGKVD